MGVVLETLEADYKAKSEESVESVTLPPQKRPAPDELTPEATMIYETLGSDSITVEQISSSAGCDIAQVLSALTELEIWGLIRMLPGRRIQVK